MRFEAHVVAMRRYQWELPVHALRLQVKLFDKPALAATELLVAEGCRDLFVATLDEAITVREAAAQGATFILTPEGTNLLDRNRDRLLPQLTLLADDPVVNGLRALAAEVRAIQTAVKAGECVAVVGLSGAGKSNLLGFLAAHQPPDGPTFVLVDGNLVTGQNPASSEEAARELLKLL